VLRKRSFRDGIEGQGERIRMVPSKKIARVTLLAGFVGLAGALVLQTKPVMHVHCEYGTPAAVTVYSFGNLAGMVVVQDGTASKVELIGQQVISVLINKTREARLQKQVFVDPRFGPSDADRYVVETWANGEQVKELEAYSCDEDAISELAQQVFTAAKIQHRYQCS